jgi:hypothetical protein
MRANVHIPTPKLRAFENVVNKNRSTYRRCCNGQDACFLGFCRDKMPRIDGKNDNGKQKQQNASHYFYYTNRWMKKESPGTGTPSHLHVVSSTKADSNERSLFAPGHPVYRLNSQCLCHAANGRTRFLHEFFRDFLHMVNCFGMFRGFPKDLFLRFATHYIIAVYPNIPAPELFFSILL